MELTNTDKFRKTPFRMISGGEKQRVLLAKALAQEPDILLLDEPTNHLDIKHTFHMLDLLKEQQGEGLTVFAILHDLNVASLYANRIGLLEKGRLVEAGDVELFRKEKKLKQVYGVEVKTQSHSEVPKPQIHMTPKHAHEREPIDFVNAYTIKKNDSFIHVQFDQPLRTISNGVLGEGIQWLKHFCNFHVDKHYQSTDPKQDVQCWMEKNQIPHEQAVAMMTSVDLANMVMDVKVMNGIQMMAIVTAGVGNAVDIAADYEADAHSKIGTINTMLFIDANFTDGALVNGYMSATEAKVKALHDLKIKDPLSSTYATGTSTDALLLALTQQGEKTPYAGSATAVGKGIGKLVYTTTQEAIRKYINKTHSLARMERRISKLTERRLVIAGTGSNVGKTTLTIGIMSALKKRGLDVQGFKCGPDFIDPSYHTAVTNRVSRNLDSWMLREDTVLDTFIHGSKHADISIIEGVMGFFDGKSSENNSGSTAEISMITKSPVLLVVDCASMARSAAAIVKGFQVFDERVHIAGVIANNVGSPGHFQLVKTAIEQECEIPVIGYLQRETDIEIPSRHLGLIPYRLKEKILIIF